MATVGGAVLIFLFRHNTGQIVSDFRHTRQPIVWTRLDAVGKFDIEAKLPEGDSGNQVPQMLQALLAERFKLVIHCDKKDQTVLALVVEKNGLRLRKAGSC